MRTYYIETFLKESQRWLRQSRPYTSCAKAHRAAKRLQEGPVPARVIMSLRPVSLKDLRLALAARRSA